MLAAMKCARNSVGIEIDPEYCSLAARRLATETGSLFSAAELQLREARPAPLEGSMVWEQVARYGNRRRQKVAESA